MGGAAAIGKIPADPVQIGADTSAVYFERALRARPAGIFPLAFGRQVETVAPGQVARVQAVQFVAEFYGLVPGDPLDREIRPFTFTL